MKRYFRHPETGQIRHSSSEATERFLTSRGYTPHTTPTEGGELKGQALDNALDEADLPKTGTADEKRARLREHLENPPTSGDFDTPVSVVDPDPSQTPNA